jgi:signal transduction histidine kinase
VHLWRGPFGLRGRIVGAALVTTVLTLVVAAVALLGPLETKLRTAEFKTFQNGVGRTVPLALTQIDLYKVARYEAGVYPPPLPISANPREVSAYENDLSNLQDARGDLGLAENQLVSRIGASEVAVLGQVGTGSPRVISAVPPGVGISSADGFGDAVRLLGLHRRNPGPIYSTSTLDGSQYARAALPFYTQGPGEPRLRWVLAVRAPFAEVNQAVHTVRIAFFDAALAALALTLIFAIPLSFTLVRRLRSLREAAREVARHGPGGVKIPADRARDEVGDLARTFALMQEQLLRQEEARRAFVATASHELRTPLTSLEGMLELLADGLGDRQPDLEDARGLVARARAQSHRLGRLAADLLDLSRLDAQVALRSEPVELGELSRAVLAEFELGTTARGVNAELQEAGGPLWALGDPGSVARILRILLDNALRVAPEGSRIVVALGRDGGQALLSVCDEGPGVPDSEREQIFERFHRGPETSGQAGFGLGLAIGRELAERMGGALVLRPGGPGATFSLGLPLSAAPDRDSLALA